jgi:hypothetical protein
MCSDRQLLKQSMIGRGERERALEGASATSDADRPMPAGDLAGGLVCAVHCLHSHARDRLIYPRQPLALCDAIGAYRERDDAAARTCCGQQAVHTLLAKGGVLVIKARVKHNRAQGDCRISAMTTDKQLASEHVGRGPLQIMLGKKKDG